VDAPLPKAVLEQLRELKIVKAVKEITLQ